MNDFSGAIEALHRRAEVFDQLVMGAPGSVWDLDTPAAGWTIAHQVAHVTHVFDLAGTAAADPGAFQQVIADAEGNFDGAVNAAVNAYLLPDRGELLTRWCASRQRTESALAAVPPNALVPWLVRPLPPEVLACAGITELFGHGQDIADTIGARHAVSDDLRYPVAFAALVWDFGYQSRGLVPPAEPVRFEITAPSGAEWRFGPPGSTQVVRGPANDLCLLVTRRRHRDDVEITASGAEADRWISLAQAYRGPAGPGRVAGQFASRSVA